VWGVVGVGVAGMVLVVSGVLPQSAGARSNAKLPDLAIDKVVIVSHSSGRLPPYFLRSGRTITPDPTVIVTFSNRGAATRDTFYVTAEITGAVEEGHKPKLIEGLGRHATVVRAFTWTNVAPRAFGTAKVRVALDPQGQIHESSERNNSKVVTFVVMPEKYNVFPQTLAKESDLGMTLELRSQLDTWSFEGEDGQVPGLDYQLGGGLQYNVTINQEQCHGQATGYGGGNGATMLRVEVPIGTATPHYDTVIETDSPPLVVHVACGGSPPDYDAPVPWLGFHTGLMRSAAGVSRLTGSLAGGPVNYTWDFVGVP
jgi:hypothetical protein